MSQVAFVVVVVLLWQWASTSGHIDPFFFGRPTKIWDQLTTWWDDGSMTASLRSTATLLVVGFLAGLLAGSVLGALLAFSRLARDVLEPFVVFLNAVPRIILYPFLLVWFGFGLTPAVVIIVVVMLPTVAIGVEAGFKDVEGAYLANMRALGAGRIDLALHVYVPSLALWLLSTCRVSFAFAFQAAIVAELLASTQGLGFLVVQGESHFDVNAMYAAMVLVVLLAIVADAILSAMEHRATRWMPAR
jgi:NitT/TauT family transport system permease protein